MDKFANLPGIAKNEPDLYETQTVTNTNFRPELIEDDSSNVQKINISNKEAQEKFNKTSLNSDFVDFSDTITNRRKFGYLVEPETFEWNQDPTESILQKFKRLERELEELKTELAQADKITNEDETIKIMNYNPIELSKQVEQLQKQIKSLHLNSIGVKTDISHLDNKAKKQSLIDHLNELKKNLTLKETSSSKESESSIVKQDSSIVFKLFADLEQVDLKRANRLSELNERILNLEKVFGAGNSSINEVQISKLCSNIENKTILGLVENLSSKLNLIDNQSLEQIESRLQLVNQRVNSLNEKKGLIEDQEKLNRVNELFNMVSNWKDVSTQVPVLVEKLTSLNELHQKAFQFASVLSRVDTEQEQLKQSVQTSKDTLEQVKKNLESNLESIKNNFDSLNQKILNLESNKK